MTVCLCPYTYPINVSDSSNNRSQALEAADGGTAVGTGVDDVLAAVNAARNQAAPEPEPVHTSPSHI